MFPSSRAHWRHRHQSTEVFELGFQDARVLGAQDGITRHVLRRNRKKFSSGRLDQYAKRFIHPLGISPLNVAAHPSHAHMHPEMSASGIVLISNAFALRRSCLFIANLLCFRFRTSRTKRSASDWTHCERQRVSGSLADRTPRDARPDWLGAGAVDDVNVGRSYWKI